MTNSISKKLTITTAIILVVSLSILCFVISAIYQRHMYNNIKEQLVLENRLANKLYQNNLKEPDLYKVLTDSINLVYSNNNKTGLELEYTSNDNFSQDTNIEYIVNKFLDERKSIITVNINSQEYLCAFSAIRNEEQKRPDSIVISLISTKSIQSLTKKFYWALAICLVVLSIISTIIVLMLSNRITKPIKELTALSKEYAARNFSKKYIADTNDEVQQLAESINIMAESLQEHDREKERLFRNISHELKTPLTAIYGYAEGVKTGVFTDASEPLDIIMKESLRIKEYAENLIFLSKLESQMEVFNFKYTNVSSTIESSIKSIEGIAILNDIDIFYEPISLPNIKIDADKIFIAFYNILSNCIKYTKGAINIEMSENSEHIKINISDDGDGFDDETLDNILKGKHLQKSNGSGLGLSIVKQIIAAHDGDFIIGNLSNYGAFFQILLPKN